jgi:hypothetical protein
MIAIVWTLLLHSAFALTLQPAPLAPSPHLPFDPDPNAPVYNCTEVYQKLSDFASKSGDYQVALTNFMNQVSDATNSWYQTLQPLEGTTQTIAPDTFAPIQDGSTQIGKISQVASDNSTLLANELARILASLQPCLAKVR